MNSSRRQLLQALGAGLTSLNLPAAMAKPVQNKTQRDTTMSVNIVRYEYNAEIAWGVIRDEQITPIPGQFETTGELVQTLKAADLLDLHGGEIPFASVKLLSPVTRNQQFICQGANYRQHMIESGMNPDDKKYNMIFTKARSCISPADTNIIRPKQVKFLDYEVELGLVMKRKIDSATTITDANLHEYIAGAVIVNDVSARDVQVPQMQFYKGKSFRSFGPVGPYLCLLSPEDIPLLNQLRLSLTVNGVTRQDDSTANLVYGPAETLTELSGVQDFAPGDLLATGTPAGCALTVPPPWKQRLAAMVPEATKWKLFFKIQSKVSKYLQPGDQVETRIASADGRIDLGVQRNLVVSEA